MNAERNRAHRVQASIHDRVGYQASTSKPEFPCGMHDSLWNMGRPTRRRPPFVGAAAVEVLADQDEECPGDGPPTLISSPVRRLHCVVRATSIRRLKRAPLVLPPLPIHFPRGRRLFRHRLSREHRADRHRLRRAHRSDLVGRVARLGALFAARTPRPEGRSGLGVSLGETADNEGVDRRHDRQVRCGERSQLIDELSFHAAG